MSEKLDGMKIAKIAAAALIAVGTIAKAGLDFVTNQMRFATTRRSVNTLFHF